jgi:hypothetical protein
VFEAVRRFLDAAVSTRVVSPEILNPFVLRTGDSPFLFDDDLAAYLKQMQERAGKAQGVYLTMEAAPDMPPNQKAAAAAAAGDHLSWLVNQIDGLPDKFRPFLDWISAAVRRCASYGDDEGDRSSIKSHVRR